MNKALVSTLIFLTVSVICLHTIALCNFNLVCFEKIKLTNVFPEFSQNTPKANTENKTYLFFNALNILCKPYLEETPLQKSIGEIKGNAKKLS